MTPPSTRQLFELSGRNFLVVGGARTLGWDMALALAEFGANGVITSRTAAASEAAAARMAEQTGRTITGIALDAADEASVESAVKLAAQRLGTVDILINNVGGSSGAAAPAAPENRPLEMWEAVQRVNVTAPFLICKHVIPVMLQQGSGSIINIASIAGVVGRDRRVYPPEMVPQPVDYAAAKGAVIGFTRDLAGYLGPKGIRVNAISPGGFQRGQPEAFIAAYSDRCMLGRMGRDGVDLKGAAVFLASEASAYVTGQNLIVDGGFTCWK